MFALAAATLALAVQAPAELDVTIKSLYSVISGPAGQKRDWAKFRSLFAPEAKMRVVGKTRLVVITPEEYERRSGPVLEEKGFFEKEVRRRVETYGGLAHVWSTYESFAKADDKTPIARGINSIQLAKTADGWQVVSITWTDEATVGKPPR